ncbi:hypothetical protein BCR39DRAFT_520475 [Naematelia encephala]|uniref:Uncharacterized protein n=1 Tax=Naematelia encephala TaxID=71784 RepID=A0A1Y2BF98_9TREE|nr:hypothetical protein BCR39DRAFT_520475 [Naematelia encephala]
MNDPTLSPFSAPPPRYLVESDSSDEEGHGEYPGIGPSSSRQAPSEPIISIDLVVGPEEGLNAVLAVGQAGRYIVKKAGLTQVILRLKVDKTEVGRGYYIEGKEGKEVVVVFDTEGDKEWSFAAGEKLLHAIKAKSWTLVTTYAPQLYIHSSSSSSETDDPPIRCLVQQGRGSLPDTTEPYRSPNYVTGVVAAIVSLAAHPASPLEPSTPIQTLLLPLPLSSLPRQSLQSALSPSLPALSSRIAASNTQWTEDNDEAFTSFGQGRIVNNGRSARTEDGAGMYM